MVRGERAPVCFALDANTNVASASENVATMGRVFVQASSILHHANVRATLLRAHANYLVSPTLELQKTLVSKGFQRALINLH